MPGVLSARENFFANIEQGLDGRLGIVQPYLHARRGVDSPVLVLRSEDSEPGSRRGLLPIFEQAFGWLWERRTPAC